MSNQGQLSQSDFFDNIGGLNLSDSPFKVKDGQATDGMNYTYTQTGGIRKRPGHPKINSVANDQLKSIGLALNNTSSGSKTVIRGAGTKIQTVDLSSSLFINLTEDTTAVNSDFLNATSTTQLVFSQFNTAISNALWMTGAGSSTVYGNYSTTKVTANGSVAPAGTVTPVIVPTSGGVWVTPGLYRYAFAIRKTGTQALSNVGADTGVTVVANTDTVSIPLASLTGIDVAKYDMIYIYRSAVTGAVGFTTGDLVAMVASNSTVYIDNGSSIGSSLNIPRAGNLLLDNSPLPAGTYKTLTTFKQRLITAKDSTIYGSDLNKPESWPAGNTITIPSGGPITSLQIISFTSVGSNTIDEILVIHKETEMWVVTGTGDFTDIENTSLKYISKTGSPNQTAVVAANGYLFWINYEQVYLWAGTGKPIECARLIKPLFYQDGDIDKSKLTLCVGSYYKKYDQVVWALSHKIYGEQKYQLKLDLRLTIPSVDSTVGGQSIDAVFIQDNTAFPVYALASFLPASPDELLLMGDNAGYLYKGFQAESDAGQSIAFKYATKQHDCGNPAKNKRFNYVIVWVEEVGDWNLTLDWWTDYKNADGQKSTRALPISTSDSNAAALWDVAQWDVAFWDDYNSKLTPLKFMLSSDASNNSMGSSIRLQFRQEGVDQPVTISGYSIVYSEEGMIK